MSDDDAMCYVAADPTQQGTAWGAAVDKPEFAKDTAKAVAQWIKEGAIVMRVPVTEAREMLVRWKRPEKQTIKQGSLL